MGTDAGDLADFLLTACSFPNPSGGRVDLAVSGGADSMALLILAARACLEGTVIHVDHGLRDGSAQEAAVVAAAADRFGMDFAARRVSVDPGSDLEARARSARYGVLPEGVMTGHTMDDQAETVLLNVLRGAALDGLAGMAAGGDRVRRPLLGLRRSETSALCDAFGIEPVVDHTNSDKRFRRNRVRADLIPMVNDIAGRDVVPVLARQAEHLATDRSFLELAAAAIDPTDVKAVRSAHPALARRALRSWLRQSGDDEAHPPSSADLGRVIQVVEGRFQACEIEGGRRIERSAGRLRLGQGTPRP